jgi:hypothetical protein
MKKKAAVLLLALALGAGCTGPLHVATVASNGVQGALLVTSSTEQEASDQGLITPEQHRANVRKLNTAADLHEKAVNMILTTPDKGSPPAAYYALAAQGLALVQDVIELLPSSASRTQAAALAKKGIF